MVADKIGNPSPKPVSEDHLPKAIAESEMDFPGLGLKVKVHVLDDGRRVFDAESMEKLLAAMGLIE